MSTMCIAYSDLEEVSVVLVVGLKLKAEVVVPAEPKDQDGVDGLSATDVILGELQVPYVSIQEMVWSYNTL